MLCKQDDLTEEQRKRGAIFAYLFFFNSPLSYPSGSVALSSSTPREKVLSVLEYIYIYIFYVRICFLNISVNLLTIKRKCFLCLNVIYVRRCFFKYQSVDLPTITRNKLEFRKPILKCSSINNINMR